MSSHTPIRVHHVVDGPEGAPVVVLSNSLGSTLDMWEPQVPDLAERYRVVRYDSRGHGRSPVPPGPYDIEELGLDLVGLLDELGAERAHLVGLSIGGQTVLWVAAHAPERVASIVTISSPATNGAPQRYLDRAAVVRREGTASIAESVVERWLTPAFALASPDLVARLQAMVASTPAEGYAGTCEVVGTADLEPDLPLIRARALCIAGRDDPAVTVELVEKLARGLPNGRLEVVDGAAHLANLERPDEVTRLILGHISDGAA